MPVLTIPPPVRQPGSPLYKTILCPLDFSAASIRALEYALSLAKEANARLILLHAIENVLGDASAQSLGHPSVPESCHHSNGMRSHGSKRPCPTTRMSGPARRNES